jgi:acyl-CoA reductase-like NAD-dependent aldehyde dehydrogenase
MNEIPRLLPWIGSPASVSADANFSPLVSPIDGSVTSQMIEADNGVTDAAVKHAHQAYQANHDATTAKRIEWLLAAADAMDKIETQPVRALDNLESSIVI